eukprot:gene23316-biopygen16340
MDSPHTHGEWHNTGCHMDFPTSGHREKRLGTRPGRVRSRFSHSHMGFPTSGHRGAVQRPERPEMTGVFAGKSLPVRGTDRRFKTAARGWGLRGFPKSHRWRPIGPQDPTCPNFPFTLSNRPVLPRTVGI